MSLVDNFITDIIDEALQKGASDIVLMPLTSPAIYIQGTIQRNGREIDVDELIEDTSALGIALDKAQDFYYYHPVDDEHFYRIRVNVILTGLRQTPSVTLRPIHRITRIELEGLKAK